MGLSLSLCLDPKIFQIFFKCNKYINLIFKWLFLDEIPMMNKQLDMLIAPEHSNMAYTSLQSLAYNPRIFSQVTLISIIRLTVPDTVYIVDYN